MARRRRARGGKRGGRRRARGGKSFSFVVPFGGFVEENKEQLINGAQLIPKTQFQSACWRILYVKGQFNAHPMYASGTGLAPQDFSPACVQIILDSGMDKNVEGLNSTRFFCGINPVYKKINMPSPNLWKEDEQRSQNIITIQNIGVGPSGGTTMINFLLHVCIQFKNPMFAFTPKQFGFATPLTRGLSDETSTSTFEEV